MVNEESTGLITFHVLLTYSFTNSNSPRYPEFSKHLKTKTDIKPKQLEGLDTSWSFQVEATEPRKACQCVHDVVEAIIKAMNNSKKVKVMLGTIALQANTTTVFVK